MVVTNACNLATLAPYVPSAAKPWNLERSRHVMRRLGYGLDIVQETAALTQNPVVFVENLITESINFMNTPAPAWANMSRSSYTNFNTERGPQILAWTVQSLNDALDLKLRAKMTLFWLNHFVTRVQEYNAPSWQYQYYHILQTHALGNFKTLTKSIGTCGAMLSFLNGLQNRRNNPNENYARELFELFTLGQNNNYTQNDVTEAARALTGYNSLPDLGAPITFNSATFDNNPKTIFGVTANFNHDTLIDHLFTVRALEISDFVVKKLYKGFVSPELPEQSIIDQLAATFRGANWELAPVLRQLFKSEHFFDDAAIGSCIKDPIECMLTFIKEAGLTINDAQLRIIHFYCTNLGQEYYNPVDVAGWQGDRAWINSSTLTGRWQGLEYILGVNWNLNREFFRDIALDSSSSTNDVAIIARDIVDRFIPKSLYTTTDYALATQVFKGEVPQNYFDTNQWNLQWNTVPDQVALLLRHIFRLPEFQLK